MNSNYSKEVGDNSFTNNSSRPITLFSDSPWQMTTPLSPPLTKEEKLLQEQPKQPWHSLWSTPTWTPFEQHAGADYDFFGKQRSKSISTTTTALKDYFYERSGQSMLVSPLAIKPYRDTGFTSDEAKLESIWTSEWPLTPFHVSNGDERRHSVAITHSTINNRPLTPPQLEAYENCIDIQGLGKGMSPHQLSDNCIYKVEFKQHRSGYFYIHESDNLVINISDNVIVEGDRGYDLGKVVSITNKEEVDKENIKRIISLSNSEEMKALALKSKDEEKALLVCQAKIKQKKLNMEVFDAEYQWDRRKLTFYFKANERIDFRELVRELFKIYKTRIWMCASTALPN